MSQKRVSVIISILIASLAIILLAGSVIAATNTTNSLAGFDKGYSCLTDLVNTKGAADLTTEELTDSILALGYNTTLLNSLKTELDNRKDTNNACWPKGACTLKETALAMMAYDHISVSTSDIQSWLENQSIAPSDLQWYLQIDNLDNNLTVCKLYYRNESAKTINIDENKFISGSPGSCFSLSSNSYWLQVNPACYGVSFEISCNANFLTSTFYKQKSGSSSGPFYVTSSTQTSSPDGKLTEKVDSICLKQGSSCNYEGSLWASLALDKKDSQFKNKILPYLITMAPDNQRYLPSGFIYALTGFSEYFSDLSSKQDKKGYWRVAEASRQYYDTAVALLSLFAQSDSTQSQKAKEYLTDPTVQQAQGCWNNNIRDAALLLYAASPRTAGSVNNVVVKPDCTSQTGYSCMASLECENLNGTVFSDKYSCFVGSCCNKQAEAQKTCSDMKGKQCSYGQDCEGGTMDPAADTSFCCINGNCVDKQEPIESNCPSPYTCKVSCGEGEEEQSSYTCAENGKCCATVTPPTSSGISPWIIILLVVLIILLGLAIYFRNQLKIWWFKITGNVKKGGPIPPQGRPPFPPTGPRPPMPMSSAGMPRRIMPALPAPAPSPARPFPKEKELNETLGKLKQMSK